MTEFESQPFVIAEDFYLYHNDPFDFFNVTVV